MVEEKLEVTVEKSCAAEQEAPETEAPALEEQIDLRRALARIPRSDRLLLWQAYVQGLKSTDIAAGLGVAPQAARQRIARAAGRLRRALGPGYDRASSEPA